MGDSRRRLNKEVLSYVNSVRERLGAPPMTEFRRGNARQAKHCFLVLTVTHGQSWTASTDGSSLYVYQEGHDEPLVWESMPFGVVQFLRRFDNLEYRDLLGTYPDCVPCQLHPHVL